MPKKKSSAHILQISMGIVLASMLAIPSFLSAQTPENQNRGAPDSNQPSSDLTLEEGKQVSCFDYYDFGSVDLNVAADRTEYSAGGPVLISGEVTNTNTYPLTSVDVVARIFKDHPNPTSDGNTLLVDEFAVAEDITLEGKGSTDISAGWSVPMDSGGGQYKVHFYVTDHDRFNMSGLSFAEDMYAATVKFNVNADTREGVYIDRGRMTVNGKKHDTKGFITKHESGQPITVKAPLVNDSESPKTVTVKQDLYLWDTQRTENKLNTRTVQRTLDPGQSTSLSYTVADPKNPAYVVDMQAKVDRETVSMGEVRFGVLDQGRPRINAAGVTAFPAGGEDELFACFHNIGFGTANTQANATLTDKESGDVLAQISVNGAMSGNIQGFADSIDTEKKIDKAKLSVSVSSNNSEIDSVEMVYSCQDIPGVECSGPVSDTVNSVFPGDSNSSSVILWSGLGVLGLLIGIGGGIYYVRKRNVRNTEQSEDT